MMDEPLRVILLLGSLGLSNHVVKRQLPRRGAGVLDSPLVCLLSEPDGVFEHHLGHLGVLGVPRVR